MAKGPKKKNADSADVTTSIENFPALVKEYGTNKMPQRKYIALRSKLLGLFLSESGASEEETNLLVKMLRKERNQSRISDAHLEILNRYEYGLCEEVAEVKTDDAPRVHFLSKGLRCRFFRDENEKGETRFIVYVPKSIPTEHQMSRELILKLERGHIIPEEEYPKIKTLIHRLSLTDDQFDPKDETKLVRKGEFQSWFNIVEDLDDILNSSDEAEDDNTDYKF